MTEKEYPEEIYGTRDGLTMTLKQRDGFGGMARRLRELGYKVTYTPPGSTKGGAYTTIEW